MRAIDRIGQKFNRLTIVGILRRNRGDNVMAYCSCECGNKKLSQLGGVVNGHAKSCGCLQKETAAKGMTTHGMYKSKTYGVWVGMVQRCTNKNNTHYQDYGGRGILVCDSWLNSFENFYRDMGAVPKNLTIERIDNNKGYSKSNCKWATIVEQSYNKRVRVDNRLGITGVQRHNNKFRARLSRKHLGLFDTVEEAIAARKTAEEEMRKCW